MKYNVMFCPYINEQHLVSVVKVTEFNRHTYEEKRFFYKPDLKEFPTEAEAEAWIFKHVKPEKMSPIYRSRLEDSITTLTLKPENLWVIYVNDYGLMSVEKVENQDFSRFEFSRLVQSKEMEGHYLTFDQQDKALAWLNEWIRPELIDPNCRPFELTMYLKETTRLEECLTSYQQYSLGAKLKRPVRLRGVSTSYRAHQGLKRRKSSKSMSFQPDQFLKTV